MVANKSLKASIENMNDIISALNNIKSLNMEVIEQTDYYHNVQDKILKLLGMVENHLTHQITRETASVDMDVATSDDLFEAIISDLNCSINFINRAEVGGLTRKSVSQITGIYNFTTSLRKEIRVWQSECIILTPRN